MRVHIDELLDHLACPARRTFRAAAVEPDRREALRLKFRQDLHRLSWGFYHQLQSGERPTLNQLHRRWAALWNPGRTKNDVLGEITSWRDVAKQFDRQGVRIASRLIELPPTTPILVGYEFDVEIGGHTIAGVFDLVREQHGRLELVDFIAPQEDGRSHVRHDWSMTIQSYAFRRMLGKPERRVIMHHLATGDESVSTRGRTDYDRLLQLVNQIAAERDGFPYPAYGPACERCQFHTYCLKG